MDKSTLQDYINRLNFTTNIKEDGWTDLIDKIEPEEFEVVIDQVTNKYFLYNMVCTFNDEQEGIWFAPACWDKNKGMNYLHPSRLSKSDYKRVIKFSKGLWKENV